MIGRRMANIIKRFARHRDDMRLAKFQRVRGLDAACPTMPKPWLKSHAPPLPELVQVQVPKTGNKASIIRLGRFISSTLPNMKKAKTHIPAITAVRQWGEIKR